VAAKLIMVTERHLRRLVAEKPLKAPAIVTELTLKLSVARE
jgi:hypothetical protein